MNDDHEYVTLPVCHLQYAVCVCGWESRPFQSPEEHEQLIIELFRHLIDAHRLPIPTLRLQNV